ncbi:ferrous iron transporter B [Mixta theicola]|uniref:Ferrous iron transporter B n=1 Tax=Mixta theicola TaxID=1458355 RepID=A0A2K1Q7B5_9GAMM|nr:fimbrial protein [Mixta theicola]PNS10943.1 ferrous iron transporter B [Mixta theicola]GLR11079.1 ferrous iron transporter B [Mixta theicola]
MKRLNKISLGMALLFASASTLAYDGTVNFNGEIIDNTCVVSLGSGGNSLIVPMGSINKSSFTGKGSVASTTQFILSLSDCPAVNARVKFDGPTYDGNQEVLALNAGAGVAEGVGIQLYDQNMTKLPLFTASNPYELQASADNDLKFYASYIATASSVSPGPANAVATFTMNYN